MSEIFSEEDRNSLAYKICMGAAVVAGGAAGVITAGFAAVPSGGTSLLFAGAGVGLGYKVGGKVCPMASERLSNKLFSSKEALTESELYSLVSSVRAVSKQTTTQGALQMLARARLASHA